MVSCLRACAEYQSQSFSGNMADPVTDEQTGEQNGGQVANPNQGTTDNETASPSKPGESIFASKGKDDPAKIFVGGLNNCTTNDSLHCYFSQFGEVVDVNVKYTQERMGNLRDPNEQNVRSRGFGFVLFKSPEVAKLVLAKEHVVDDKKIEVKKAIRQGQPRSKKLFVGGIANFISEEILNAYFSAFGSIIDIKILVNHVTQKRRGFAFIQFEDESTVDTIAEVKYHDLSNGTEKCRVEVKPVLPQTDKFRDGGYRDRGGFRGNGRRGGYGGGGGYGPHQGYQGGGHYNQMGSYNQGGRGGYNQGGYQDGSSYYQGGYDQSGYNQQQYDQHYQNYQGYEYSYNQGYGQGQGGQYANGSGYQGGYQTGYDTSNYGGGQQQYNYGSNYGQEASGYGKAPTGGYQHSANQPY
ncbi:heterogeneous nuclear ribonucleoprotein D-like [Acanthaster planci]|uniref:Heterogeneous nuclear ribonucleoprotein D-like n=1 Tax=Acanthaster planci TaxID=133434 RepID=A0A8B7ZKB5_ACAPL|nr:heterogeneous nuclear ribonucleoprotein D-like [Acanthaster planci]XP_022103756.1 heterogeneous nuclear ribonucleoprotein D-like [Acanthaster planci]